MPTDRSPSPGSDVFKKSFTAYTNGLYYLFSASQNGFAAFSRYANEFMIPYMLATNYFRDVELRKVGATGIQDTVMDYTGLGRFSADLTNRALVGAVNAFGEYVRLESGKTSDALADLLLSGNAESLEKLFTRKTNLLDLLAHRYPEAIQAIEPEYGFHFERDTNVKVAETDRFILYQVLPTDPKCEVRKQGKPVLILPPYVLGANILGFLPGDDRSYAHSFANQGIPTYIRILKDIQTSEALQVMTGEDDARDTRLFCEAIRKRNTKPVTLNGYCQGGYSALCNLLSGELDGLVDAFITCVAPMDGTHSEGLTGFLADLPRRFNDLEYGTKTLSNGNTVADGKLMGWVYKLKSIEDESPIAAFYRDLMMFARQENSDFKISKTAAALNYWLNNERNDLPMEITRMSFTSYNTPIGDDGTLPVTLFDRKLNLHRLAEKKIPWLICYGLHDNLVEPPTALAPLDHIQAEVSAFPKGHVAIATSWSDPNSACALHTRFGDENYRGPVRYHLDLEDAMAREEAPKQAKKKAAKTSKKSTTKAAKKSLTDAAKESLIASAKKRPTKAAKKPTTKTVTKSTKKAAKAADS
ncbi:hypothetical protein D3OALGA1CA_3456 [Olavius algarvensis associated proteobacterium Delta 3]|nr:hypothetical protein D3OALGA1CA_3456 [Olavius algarvensis associated proteobacterium Delta 3]